VLLATVSTCTLLDLPITMTEIAVLIPPVSTTGQRKTDKKPAAVGHQIEVAAILGLSEPLDRQQCGLAMDAMSCVYNPGQLLWL
jgi:hypothetical protein